MTGRHSVTEKEHHRVLTPSRESGMGRRLWKYRAAPDVSETHARQFHGILADQISEQAKTMRADIQRVARRPHNILIIGETGTGKTYAAREIHRRSQRAGNPFVELNCANFPEQLVEAELFGYCKGAFTGAERDHGGLFEAAKGGILFLDEIGDIAPTVQNNLLRAIEDKQIKRLGSNNYVFCDVQIIAATSRNLQEMIERREFREDLYDRLAVLTIQTTPLRERREDLPAMIGFFLREAAGATDRSAKHYDIEEGAVALLCACDYPGNIRSLRNLIYELTSYIEANEPISIELVHSTLNRVRPRGGDPASMTNDTRHSSMADPSRPSTYVGNVSQTALAAPQPHLSSIADEGDIILPLELCVLYRGETFKQWNARAKRCSIEAARQATGGTMQGAAERLGLTASSLKGHLYRSKRTQNRER